jgi:hypothetical protein
MIAKIKREYENIMVFYHDYSTNANFRLLQRHNNTKRGNKIPAKICDFTVAYILKYTDSCLLFLKQQVVVLTVSGSL